MQHCAKIYKLYKSYYYYLIIISLDVYYLKIIISSTFYKKFCKNFQFQMIFNNYQKCIIKI